MKLQCISMPRKVNNCFVATLGAGKAVKFSMGQIVDLTDKKYRLDDPAHVGHLLLGRYPKNLRMLVDPPAQPLTSPSPPVKSPSPQTKQIAQAPRNK